ncbi:MAG: FecR family protein [Agriterribacter sp.]
MPTSRLKYLFRKYIQNECSLQERHEFLQLLHENKNDDELKILLTELAAHTSSPHAVLPDASGDAILRAILGAEFTAEQQSVEHPAKVKAFTRRKKIKWMAVAASVALVISISYMLKSSGKKNITTGTKALAAAKTVINTHTGESKTVQLSDGTKIWLSPSSSLEYPSVFNDKTREVQLSGEAFFEVAHNPQQPFIIHSGKLQTRVLGTSFNIQAYDSQENIAVTVVTGKVKVSNEKEVAVVDIELLPNQRAVFDKKTDKLIKENTDSTKAPEMLKRKEGTFVYRDEPLYKVAKDIETYFGVSIQIPDAIKQCRVGATVEITDDSPESTLNAIAISINATLQVNHKKFTLSGDGCPE